MKAAVYLNIGILEAVLFRYIQTLVFTLNLMRALHLKNTLKTIMNSKKGICIDCGQNSNEKPLIAGRCQMHYWQYRAKKNAEKKPKEVKPRKAIPKVSAKRKIENREYTIKRLQFLAQPENQRCFIDGCNAKADTIEHSHGRWGKNFLDVSTWRPCCNYHNLELERNSELSEKYQVSKISGKQKIIKKCQKITSTTH